MGWYQRRVHGELTSRRDKTRNDSESKSGD